MSFNISNVFCIIVITYNSLLFYNYMQDSGSFALLLVTASDPNSPVLISFQNKTESYTVAFLTFEAKQPAKEYFDLPSPCKKNRTMAGAANKGQLVSNSHVPPSLPPLSFFVAQGSWGRNMIKGDYTKTMHPVVKEMLEHKLSYILTF